MVLFTVIIAISSCSATDKRKPTHVLDFGSNDLKEEKLRGKVKLLKSNGANGPNGYETTYSFDSLGFLYEKKTWSNLKESKTIYFHANNLLVWQKHLYDDEIKDSTIYVSNENGNVIKAISYIFNSDTIVTSEICYFYSGHKNFAKSILIGSNKDTFLIKENILDSNGKILSRVAFCPPRKSNLNFSISKMYFDGNGNCIMDSIFFNGLHTGLNKFLYDEFGNEIESTNSNILGIPQTITTSYIYDDFENWIKSESITNADEKGKHIISRTITYY